MRKQNLSTEQQNIVEQWLASGEPMLVEASAGSGKTRVLTEAVRRIIEASPKNRSKILCLTFTNKAAEEMEDRLKNLNNINERTFIGTTHAFALDVLKSRRHELGINEMPTIIDKESDSKEILTEAILANPNLTKHYLNPPADTIEKFKSLERYQADLLNKWIYFIRRKKQKLVWLNNGSDSTLNGEWTPERISLYKDYTDLQKNQNLIDYDDIILLTWKILSERPSVANLYRRIYEYILVDEAQDLSFAQYELIKALCGNSIRKVMMVGDSNQAIHGYAGASSQFMTQEFVKDFSLTEQQQKKIQYNYRSSKSIIKLANELAGIQQNNTESYYDGQIEFLTFENEVHEASWIISKLNEITETESDAYDGKLTLNKIAILGRNRFVFSSLIEKLEEEPKLKNLFFLRKGSEILDPQSTTMKIFDLGTRIICNQRAYLYYNQLIDVLGIYENFELPSSNYIEFLRDTLSKNNIDYIPKITLNCIVECWQDLDNEINKFPHILKKLLDNSNMINEENERNLVLNDIQEWKEAWDKYIRSVGANSKSISDFRRFLAMGIVNDQKQHGLTLATVHTVKGLEFHVVFLIGMGQGTFPDYRAIRKNNLIEEKNNAYVAVTRAKRDLYVTYPKSKAVPWGKINQVKSEFFSTKNFYQSSSLKKEKHF